MFILYIHSEFSVDFFFFFLDKTTGTRLCSVYDSNRWGTPQIRKISSSRAYFRYLFDAHAGDKNSNRKLLRSRGSWPKLVEKEAKNRGENDVLERNFRDSRLIITEYRSTNAVYCPARPIRLLDRYFKILARRPPRVGVLPVSWWFLFSSNLFPWRFMYREIKKKNH